MTRYIATILDHRYIILLNKHRIFCSMEKMKMLSSCSTINQLTMRTKCHPSPARHWNGELTWLFSKPWKAVFGSISGIWQVAPTSVPGWALRCRSAKLYRAINAATRGRADHEVKLISRINYSGLGEFCQCQSCIRGQQHQCNDSESGKHLVLTSRLSFQWKNKSSMTPSV